MASGLRPRSKIDYRSLNEGESLPRSNARQKTKPVLLEEIYFVERIIGRKETGQSACDYLVKWRDYPVCDATWEPKANLPTNIIDTYIPSEVEYERLRPFAESLERAVQSRLKCRNPVFSLFVDSDLVRYVFGDISTKLCDEGDFCKLNLPSNWYYILHKDGTGRKLKFPVKLSVRLYFRTVYVKSDGQLLKKIQPVEKLNCFSATEACTLCDLFHSLPHRCIITMAETPQKQQTIDIGSHSPATLQLKDSNADVAITLDVSNKILRTIYAKRSNNLSLTEQLNEELKYIRLLKSDRLESRLYTEGCRIDKEYRKLKGGNDQTKHNQKIRKIAILKHEIENATEIQTNRFALESASTPKHVKESPKIENEKENVSYTNEGPRIDNSSQSVKKKVIRNLEENVNKALDFVETYGVLPKSLICESFDGESCILSLDGCHTPPSRNPNYNDMKSPEKKSVRKLLQVCDNSMISDSAYHELAMHVPEMPRKHLLVSCRNEENTNFKIKRTPSVTRFFPFSAN